MLATNWLIAGTSQALAKDSATLAKASGSENKVRLVCADFTPGPATDYGSLTAATFTGSTALSVGSGDQTEGRDPVTGRRKIIFKEPVGGWTWTCTVPGDPAQTVYGYAVTNNAGTVTYGSAKLSSPVTMSASGDVVSIGEVSLLLAAVPFE